MVSCFLLWLSCRFNHDWKEKSQAPAERVYLDISSIRGTSYGGSCIWVLIVDDYTDYSSRIFSKAKDGVKFKVMTLLTDLKVAGVNAKLIRSDDSSKNRTTFEECQSKGYSILFEFSGPQTPHVMVRLKESFKPSLGRLELC